MNADSGEREALIAASMEALREETVDIPLAALRRLAAQESWPNDKLDRIYAATFAMLIRQHETVMRSAIEAGVDRAFARKTSTLH